MALLEGLTSEQRRWSLGASDLSGEIDHLAGDAVLASFFLTYAGAFDQRQRADLTAACTEALGRLRVPHTPALSFVQMLSTAEQRQRWARRDGLPAEGTLVENAILLEPRQAKRCPMLVEPRVTATCDGHV